MVIEGKAGVNGHQIENMRNMVFRSRWQADREKKSRLRTSAALAKLALRTHSDGSDLAVRFQIMGGLGYILTKPVSPLLARCSLRTYRWRHG